MFALVDCNNFYASCERVFNPMLQGRAVVVLSNNDGCVIARSNEAKALGIAMGAPFYEIKDLADSCGVAVLSSNYALYGDFSARVMSILSRFSPDVEFYSIDEAFLDFSGLGDVDGHARILRDTVGQWTGIPVSVGVAPTKTLAKVANNFAKKIASHGGVLILNEGNREYYLGQMSVGDVWGVGRRWKKRLSGWGVHTALDLARLPPMQVRQSMNVVAERVVRELCGFSCLSLEGEVPPPQQIITSRSFRRKLTLESELLEAVATYASRAGEKLRAKGMRAGSLNVFVHTNPFSGRDASYSANRTVTFEPPTLDGARLVAGAEKALLAAFRPGYRYHKAGVVLSELVKNDEVAPCLPLENVRPEAEEIRARAVMIAMDSLNQRMGRETVRLAATGFKRPWQMKRQYISPSYTTRWDELKRVR